MKALNIGFELPAEVVTQRSAIIGRTGSGKSYTLRVLVEELVQAGLPVVVLDPMGSMYGLRSSADGKKAGLPVTIIGGEHGDVPLEPSAGAVVADLVVDTPSAYILDLSSFDTNAEEDRFAEAFAHRLFRAKAANKTAMCLIVDEADRFAPQRPFKGQEKMLGAFSTLSRRARQRGLGLVLATQRPASLNKHVLTQSELLIVHQLTGPQDRDAVDEWVKMHGSADQRKEFLTALPKLKVGEAFAWSPSWLDSFDRVTIRPARTFDSSRTPEPGAIEVQPAKLATVELEALRERMAATVEKAKANDPGELKRRIRELEKQLKDRSAAPAPEPQPMVPEGLPEALDDIEKRLDGIRATAAGLTDAASDAIAELTITMSSLRKLAVFAPQVSPIGRTHREAVNERMKDPEYAAVAGASLSKAERSFLSVLAQFPAGRTRTQLCMLSKYSVTSGHVDNTLGKLRTRGLVHQGQPIRITEQGLAALGHYELLPEGEELFEYWCNEVGKAGATFLRILAKPTLIEGLSRNDLAVAAGYSIESGHVDNTLGRLRTLQLVERGQPVRLHPDFREAIGR